LRRPANSGHSALRRIAFADDHVEIALIGTDKAVSVRMEGSRDSIAAAFRPMRT
jgi:hypothetical protein